MDIMIDIETLSTDPNAVVIGYSAFVFDLTESPNPDHYRCYDDITNTIRVGDQPYRHIDTDTLQWWMDQPETFLEITYDSIHPNQAMQELHDFVIRQCDKHNSKPSQVKVWAKSPSFDLIIIKTLAEDHGITMPWHYANERDVRTLFDIANYKPKSEAKHTQWQDCIAQIEQCQEAYQQLKPNPYIP